MRHAARHPGGFTLIELLVTIAVAAMLGMLVVPNLVSMVQSGKTSVLVNKFPQDVAWARNQAVTTQRPVVLTIGPGNCVWSATVGGIQSVEHSMLDASSEYPGVICGISGGASQTLTFSSEGFVTAAPLVTITTPQGQSWELQVLASGSVILNSNTAN